MGINKFSKFMGQPKSEDIFHTSAFAKAANGGVGGAGAVNRQTFSERQKARRNRQVIRSYRDSHAGNAGGSPPARPIMPPRFGPDL